MEGRSPGWSAYHYCSSKSQVIDAIDRATYRAQNFNIIPVLHIEAHGCDIGLAPTNDPHAEFLTWDELTAPLQRLNLATRCNLVVVVAACFGIAAIQALTRGQRAPAVVMVGFDSKLKPTNLLAGAKEFYRRWLDDKPHLTDIAASASRETGTANFEWEPFTGLAYQVLVEHLIKSARPTEHHDRIERVRQQMLSETEFSADEIENRVSQLPLIGPWRGLQMLWDQKFMIDLNPENQERFGLDMREIVKRIEASTAYRT